MKFNGYKSEFTSDVDCWFDPRSPFKNICSWRLACSQGEHRNRDGKIVHSMVVWMVWDILFQLQYYSIKSVPSVLELARLLSIQFENLTRPQTCVPSSCNLRGSKVNDRNKPWNRMKAVLQITFIIGMRHLFETMPRRLLLLLPFLFLVDNIVTLFDGDNSPFVVAIKNLERIYEREWRKRVFSI